ncbi:hypothetical protein [Paraburkholderia tropica]|uniref:Uncharacterized protein n=1 Tax=Paraburkholderia tropica TaxID=92647 RepID=A0AAQ1GD57_9BURK|nr:hypothetical protein [Paraburkholderia tropica]RQN39866.1 hypothetical protein EHZ25_08050 [Paraburkholderia tropica]SEJ27398.1 hypothetical protein SAMN05216550_103416 [Paraburkholderia tropica]
MRPYREPVNLIFDRANAGWLGYVLYTAASCYLLMLSVDPLVTQALAVNFRSDHAAPPMTPFHWAGVGLAACVYGAGAVYAGCIAHAGKLRMTRAELLAALSWATVARGIALFLLPLVAAFATGAGLIAAGIHGSALPLVAIGVVLANWLCFRAVAWWRPRSSSRSR